MFCYENNFKSFSTVHVHGLYIDMTKSEFAKKVYEVFINVQSHKSTFLP
jgi:hypothetical protein